MTPFVAGYELIRFTLSMTYDLSLWLAEQIPYVIQKCWGFFVSMVEWAGNMIWYVWQDMLVPMSQYVWSQIVLPLLVNTKSLLI